MNARELQQFGQALGIELPHHYVRWAHRLPPAGEEDESWQPAFTDVNVLIAENLQLREDGGTHGEPWPRHLLCVGAFEGNHFFIDVRAKSDAVYHASHEESLDLPDFSALYAGRLGEMLGPTPWQKFWAGITSFIWPQRSHFSTAFSMIRQWDGQLRIVRHDNPSSTVIEKDIRLFASENGGIMRCSFDPGATWFESVDLEIAGGPNGFSIEAVREREAFRLFDPRLDGEPVNLFRGAEMFSPANEVVREIREVMAVVTEFETTGRLSAKRSWRKVSGRSA
jgi:hypothetical protein